MEEDVASLFTQLITETRIHEKTKYYRPVLWQFMTYTSLSISLYLYVLLLFSHDCSIYIKTLTINIQRAQMNKQKTPH